jgi:hypothetical protein
VEEREMQEERK